MKEDSFNFSLIDFLAYLFPGTMMILAIGAVIRISPFKYLLKEIQLNLVIGLILIACAYVVGVTISSLMVSFENLLYRYFKLPSPTSTIQFKDFEEDVKRAFTQIFGDHGEWSSNHFYLVRALVCEKMPRCAATIERQASLRQIRRNSILPVLFLGIVGGLAGLKIFLANGNHRYWGGAFVPISLLGSYVVAGSLIKNGMYRNRKREVREACCGLLAYFHSISRSQDEGEHSSHSRSLTSRSS